MLSFSVIQSLVLLFLFFFFLLIRTNAGFFQKLSFLVLK